MKQFRISFLVVVLFLGLTAIVQAAETDTVAVKVTISASLSVDITETEIDLGDVNVGTTTQSASGVTITNDGSGINETYSLNLTNPSGWTAAAAAGAETYVLNAAFDSDGAITWDTANHALTTALVASSGTQFADDQTGLSVPYNETRTLWFQFLAPTVTSETSEQTITVTITAQAG
ncbi:MAG: hypothetical protein ABH952_07490 [Candidatus Omnitrophota bacterium]